MKILITGASRGIGFQITKDLLVEKNKLILQCNKNQKKIKKYLKENNYKAEGGQVDLSSPNGVEELFNKTIEKIGFPDAIVNNAGIAESAYIEEPFFSWAEMFDKTISVNLKGPALICKEFIAQHGEDHAKKGIVLDKLTEPKDVSSVVSFIVSGKMDHSTGSTIDVNAGSYLR